MDTNKHKKRCTKCKQEKIRTEFYKNKSKKDGLYSQCKSCARKAKRKYRKANPEKIRESSSKSCRKYRKAHPEKIREKGKKYREANPEKDRERKHKDIIELRDSYVRNLIRIKYKISYEFINEELIIDYRKHLIRERKHNERIKEEQRKAFKK